MQTRVLLFYSRIVEIHVQTKPTTSLVNATALQSSRTVSAGGGGAGRCCGRGSAPAARPTLLGTRSASPAAASHPITRGAQSRRLKEGPSFEIALILVKWQRPLKITLSWKRLLRQLTINIPYHPGTQEKRKHGHVKTSGHVRRALCLMLKNF